MKIVGYSDRLSAVPGSELSFMISCTEPRFSARLVRLRHGDTNPAGPGLKVLPVPSDVDGDYDGTTQEIRTGSYVRVPRVEALRPRQGFSVQMWIWPTLPDRGTQTLISRRTPQGEGFALRLQDGLLTLQVGNSTFSLSNPVRPRTWYFVAATYDGSSGVRLVLRPSSGVTIGLADEAWGTIAPAAATVESDVVIGAETVGSEDGTAIEHGYNGKIDAPTLFTRSLDDSELARLEDGERAQLVSDAAGAWDFSQGIDTWLAHDISPAMNDGTVENQPMRGATGHNWTSRHQGWPHAPEEYGAIHFHEDDLSDAGWEPTITWTVPEDLRSGAYALHITTDGAEDYLPFIVLPPAGRQSARIALVMPTFSYLAYANERLAAPGGMFAGAIKNYPHQEQDEYMIETGMRSLYDTHVDGSGVCYASWRRPLVSVRPTYRYPYMNNGEGGPAGLAADLRIVDWLDEHGYEYDMLTDIELNDEGVERIAPYSVVLTGQHPEYVSGKMIDALQDYLDGGGRLMYLGGNGMYWVTELDEASGASVEIRRRGPADRTWDPEPGEAYLSSTGELGGLWRYRGRSPQSWLGVGYYGGGGAPGRPYERQPGSHDPRVSFVFDGLGDDEVIGDFDSLTNVWGAAGHETDATDPKLGTPEHTIVLATASGFDPAHWDVVYEERINAVDPNVKHPRGDMTMLEYPNDGAVFSVSSTIWVSCLSYKGYDNNVSRITRNVLDRFLSGGLLAPEA
ncbi:N,N-dimethylformamidase beta subunit family domain-containing protein [Streptomyces chartreusis]|uniref:N,N-dimethylformamidase beta subunit family domain-containing protein n=1 Tax=Streptomyces chartreusis TaxID=1969 RepID=UPI003D8B6813